jgi:hypothetical protein
LIQCVIRTQRGWITLSCAAEWVLLMSTDAIDLSLRRRFYQICAGASQEMQSEMPDPPGA